MQWWGSQIELRTEVRAVRWTCTLWLATLGNRAYFLNGTLFSFRGVFCSAPAMDGQVEVVPEVQPFVLLSLPRANTGSLTTYDSDG